ncbi:hypothetical protein G7085_03665 [Tessaracoccus sp. HDW20]|nr:hypothetical protein [Tessaracoccus coleopterorum]
MTAEATATDELAAYRARVSGWDELTARTGLREDNAVLGEAIGSLGLEGLTAARRELASLVRDEGILYGESGRNWIIDPLPLVIGAAEWERLEAGLGQRARLLSLILADVYGEQRLLSSGAIPPEIIWGTPASCNGPAVCGRTTGFRWSPPTWAATPPAGGRCSATAQPPRRAPATRWPTGGSPPASWATCTTTPVPRGSARTSPRCARPCSGWRRGPATRHAGCCSALARPTPPPTNRASSPRCSATRSSRPRTWCCVTARCGSTRPTAANWSTSSSDGSPPSSPTRSSSAATPRWASPGCSRPRGSAMWCASTRSAPVSSRTRP